MTGWPHRQYAAAARYELLDRGSPQLVVLLHGLGGDRNQPLGLTSDRLAGTGVSVLAPDARAHGRTELIGTADEFTSASMAADVVALVDSLGLHGRPLIPVGISMGAAVGLELVLGHPERVAGAVLIRPSFGREPWLAHQQVFRTIAGMLRSGGAEAVTTFVQSPEYRQVRAESDSAAVSLTEQFTKPRAVERVVRLETVPGNTAVEWSGERNPGRPLTVVGAHRDPGHPLAIAQLWHERLAGSSLVEVPSRDQQPAEYVAGLHRTVTEAVTALTRSSHIS